MPITEIPRQQWSEVLAAFARAHDGRSCSVEIAGGPDGAMTPARDRPLADVSEEDGRILIEVGDADGGDLDTFVIEAPDGLRLVQTDGGADQELEILAGEMRTRLRLRVPEQPAPGPTATPSGS